MEDFVKGIIAGMLISLGGTVYIGCDNKYVGALLFSLALLCICYRCDNLYTGKICYLPDNCNLSYVKMLIFCILGNAIGCSVCGLMCSVTNNLFVNKTVKMCEAKLALGIPAILIKGFFCGILIYLAVDLFKKHNTVIPIIMCVTAFILSGFEHSIADIYYFAIARLFNFKVLIFIILVVIGNAIGGMIIPLLMKLYKKSND